MEEYRDIIDFPNYQVSNLGNVKNRISNKILKPIKIPKNNGRYACYEVILRNESHANSSKGKHLKISRLVAEAFIPNPENKPFVDHIDNDSSNNHYTNLRWATPKENKLNTNNKHKFNNITQTVNISLIRGKYRLNIQRVNYGVYNTLVEAQDARMKALNGELQPVVKQVSPYGKYIRKREGRRYEVYIKNQKIGYFKALYNTLEEAVKARDEYLNTII